MTKLIVCSFILLATTGTAKSKDIAEFFPDCKTNLTKITWAHAVNSQALLKDALNSSAMMLEADVVLSHETVPIMAHPPNTTSDLTLQDFLKGVQEFNDKENNTERKGIKLDFKTIEAFNGSLAIITQTYSKIDYPVWLNADILAGPVNTTGETPVDPVKFLNGSKDFVNATLSLGWKTNYTNETGAVYSDKQVAEMLEVIAQNNVTQPITFPVRAGIAAQSLAQLKHLVDKQKGSTLTIWHGEGDHVDADKLSKLIMDVGLARVFIDVPDELKEKLKLSGGSTVQPLVYFTASLVTLMRLL